MAAARPRRLIAGVLAAGLVLLGSAACVNSSGPVTPSPSVTVSSEPATTTTVAPTSASATIASSVFPGTARLYAEAVLLAWRTNQQTRVTELVAPTVLSQLQTTTNAEPNWVYASCQGTAGSTYCQFLNGDGDAITLRLENQLLGKPRAVTEVKLDLTMYSNNAVEYVKSFIEAWRNANTKRMAVLANQSETEYFTHYTPPGTYSTCATLSGGVSNVRVYNADGLNYTLTIAVALLGGKHAITGHSATTPACT
jgi:hypothetical protein